MIKISEFTPAIKSDKEYNNTAKCQVIVNNNTLKESGINATTTTKEDESYPTIGPEPVIPQYSQGERHKCYTPQQEIQQTNTELYKHLAISFSNILKTNNPKLIANLIDMSGKVILDATDLARAISLILSIDENSIKISYEDPEATCLSKVNPIKNITSIKVNGYDFNLAFNKQYNTLSDEFNVSLKRMFSL